MILELAVHFYYSRLYLYYMKKGFVILIFNVCVLSLIAQESIIKEFSEPRRPTQWLNPIALYPSTLRMVNIGSNPTFNEIVNDIEKVLIYTLDSATIASKDYSNWMKEYEAIGYEEYFTMLGQQKMRIIGKNNEYVGYMFTSDRVLTFYLRGEIPFQKIPTLLETFQSNDVLDILTDQFK